MANPGQRVGEYVLDTVVGRGAFGEVWRARHHAWTDRVVAIKIPTDPAYLRELQREGFAAPQLEHEAIVKAIGFDPAANPPYLAMEYVAGTSLRPLIGQRALTAEASVAILRQVLAALGHAHAKGVVHRDVKPENILIDTDRAGRDGYDAPGAVKLTDFGLGQASRQLSPNSIVMSISVESPQARELVGTLDYMSPEQRGGGEVDARSDLYSCGIVLFEMLTGERPAGAEVPSDLKKDVPAWLDNVFRQAYARREARFASAEQFRAALERSTAASPVPPPNRNAKTRPCPRCRRELDRADNFCIGCGTQVVAHVRRCAACGAYPDASDRFCIQCGSTLNLSPAMT